MAFSRKVGLRALKLSGMFALTLASGLACGGGDPNVGSGPSSSVSDGGTGAKSGGGANTSGNAETGGTSAPMIDVQTDGGACGDACAEKVVCGDGVLQPSGEECDDKNTADGDGCSATCTVEAGFICPVPGVRCRAAACGDGILAGNEVCDDGNTKNGDGCSDACAYEPNFECPTPGEACLPTTCGDGKVQGSEACDDGNHYLGDGCSINCEKEPKCAPPAPCTSECGDGMKLGDEECDDGNARDGDGCSAACMVEPGWTCSEKQGDGDLVIPIVYRDFKAYQDGGHVAF